MANRRRSNGEETWYRLQEWTKGQAAAERLSNHIIDSDGYDSIDPSHPLGGRDGIKDMVCIKSNIEWVAGCYFPRGQKSFKTIKEKFLNDLKGVEVNNVDGLVFITNQELTLSERKELKDLTEHCIDIFHLERIVGILNSPVNYGVRLEFLDIEITIEEQLAFFAERDKKYQQITNTLEKLEKVMKKDRSSQIINEGDEGEVDLYEVRTDDVISEAIDELFHKVWYERHLVLKYKVENGLETVDAEVWKNALKAANKTRKMYGEENLGPYDDFEWGMLNGKLSALRWIFGDEWDMLDT
ncbi:hypothetical protein SAMN04487777_12726 [Priestia aryabhattai B8W22]|uniref:hypothetical protein n=1 Tax=Priestia aryabhattai TaxID=412384 RepID=UPI00087FCD94|nr:hypothetical protein SAMN04487777_12726 [Priestia aryabhattai B8W22]